MNSHKKMNIRTFVPSIRRLAGLGVVLAAALGLTPAASADSVTRVYVVDVPPAQDVAFTDGVKAWEKCLHDHGERQGIMAYDAQTGDLGRYLFLEEHGAWAGLDAKDPADTACAPAFRSGVLPHFTQGFSEIAQLNAKDTYMPGGDPDPSPMVWVDAYRIKAGHTQVFNDALAKFAAAAAKTHWQGHFAGYDIEGSGQGAENFVLVWPNKSWAEVGQDPKPSPKDLMESVYGKAAARSSHDKYLAAIAEEWSDVWNYDHDLSYIPGK
jgi:hypothetical protein